MPVRGLRCNMAGLRWPAAAVLTVLTVSVAQGQAPVPSVGCSCAAVPGFHWYAVQEDTAADVRAGRYLVYIPTGYTKGTPLPVFFAAHGYTSSPEIVRTDSGLWQIGEDSNAIVVFPEGEDVGPGEGWGFPGCNAVPKVGQTDCKGRRATCTETYEFDKDCYIEKCPSASAVAQSGCAVNETTIGCDLGAPSGNCNWCGCSNDEAFVRSIVTDLQDNHCVDVGRMYMSGMSQGGMFTSWLVSRMSDVFAGFTPVAGTNPRDFHEPTDASADISILWMHGTKDTTVPMDGSGGSGSSYFLYEPVAAEAAKQAKYFNCSTTATRAPSIEELATAPSSAALQCFEHVGCSATQQGSARRVAYCKWAGRHDWPSTKGAATPFWGSKMIAAYMLGRAKLNPPSTQLPATCGAALPNVTLARGGFEAPAKAVERSYCDVGHRCTHEMLPHTGERVVSYNYKNDYTNKLLGFRTYYADTLGADGSALLHRCKPTGANIGVISQSVFSRLRHAMQHVAVAVLCCAVLCCAYCFLLGGCRTCHACTCVSDQDARLRSRFLFLFLSAPLCLRTLPIFYLCLSYALPRVMAICELNIGCLCPSTCLHAVPRVCVYVCMAMSMDPQSYSADRQKHPSRHPSIPAASAWH